MCCQGNDQAFHLLLARWVATALQQVHWFDAVTVIFVLFRIAACDSRGYMRTDA